MKYPVVINAFIKRKPWRHRPLWHRVTLLNYDRLDKMPSLFGSNLWLLTPYSHQSLEVKNFVHITGKIILTRKRWSTLVSNPRMVRW